ncbi:hypothetical protein ACIP4S_32855 [Streptomyces chartreusis]|uniref:hypothetical protein n=1 Tax=Streptomyces chartreusis TaxID=1969 RepID=UPI0037FB8BC0
MKAVQAKLGELGEQCRSLPNLERHFETFSAEVDEVRSLLGGLGDALPPPMRQLKEAVLDQAQDLKDDTDNFRDYLSRQHEMAPSRYLIGRKDMGKELRQTIKAVQEFLATLPETLSGTSSLRHRAHGSIVVPVHDEDLASADTVRRVAEELTADP